MSYPLSVLDLVVYPPDRTIAAAYDNTRELAQSAERWGYRRYWMAEHHNLDGIGSAATPLLIGFVAAHTRSIRVGSGGIMLPNHSPLIVAEQFGTLATLYPKRIDLGLGRAPGTDQLTAQAIRGSARMMETDFAVLVEQLLFYFSEAQPGQKVKAIPGAGMDIPIWILGSSLYSARLAAHLGRPYSFAGHFAPQLMREAIEIYRRDFKPSAQLAKPNVMIGAPVVVADTQERAEYLSTTILQRYLGIVRGTRGRSCEPVANMRGLWTAFEEAQVRSMLSSLIVGDQRQVKHKLESLLEEMQADEAIITSDVYEQADRLRSYELLAQAMDLKPVSIK